MRADAQRNYDRLLEEARQAFIVHGTDVALEDIARHAGVGIGTLYRHFPDRYSLMSAVFEKELDALTRCAHDLIKADDPAGALTDWLRSVAVHSACYRGLSAAVMENGGLRMPSCKTRLRAAGGALLWRAQEAGAIRRDTQISDLLKLIYALVLAAEKSPQERGLFDRLMELVVDGIRTREPAPDAPETAADAPETAPGRCEPGPARTQADGSARTSGSASARTRENAGATAG